MPDSIVAAGRLESWKEIASYIGKTERTAKRWEQARGLPVHRVPGGGRQVVFAYAHELDNWLLSGSAAVTEEEPAATDDTPVTPSIQEVTVTSHSANKVLLRRILWAGAALVVIALSAFTAYRWLAPHRYVLTGETQITHGEAYTGSELVADGRNLYFSTLHEGRLVLATVSVGGGQQHIIPTPFSQNIPLSISPDGRQLLAFGGEGVQSERERALWVIPVDGGSPHRVGNFQCHTAEWTPDGKHIAYAAETSVYLTDADGNAPALLHTFVDIPEKVRWSLDGRRLLVSLRDKDSSNGSLSELDLNDAGVVETATPIRIPHPPGQGWRMSPTIDGRDDVFVAWSGPGFHDGIDSLAHSHLPWQSAFSLTPLAHEGTSIDDLAVDPAGQRLFVIKRSTRMPEIEIFDRQTREIRPFLAGIPVRYADFARGDGRIAYVRRDESDSLWIADADGSHARQIETPGLITLDLPRWSPDGKWIAFMGLRRDDHYRDYIVPVSGGQPREASHGSDNQGAPTWSPDGKRLLYGLVWCQQTQSCSIREIDLASGKETSIPGSEGLWTARWSPDGRWIAALHADSQRVWLMDRTTGRWSEIAGAVSGNDLVWAADSSAVYASNPVGDHPSVIRIGIRDRKPEMAVDFTGIARLSGRVDTWFDLTPQGQILFRRIMEGSDIFSLKYAQK